ncbi:MAG: hypothetical protein WAV54_02925 [Acidimicrobiales bacterium]
MRIRITPEGAKLEAMTDNSFELDLEAAPVLVRHDGSRWHNPEVKAYDNEAHFEKILAEEPQILPGVGVGAAVVRQLQVPGTGPADLVAVGPSGAITVCECKLAANPEIRRTVIGQVFAYASGLWRLSYEQFDSAWQMRSKDHASLLASVCADEDGDNREEFRSTVAQNLADGDFRLILAVDSITSELKRIVEYLNAHTRAGTSVIALELGFGQEAGVEILIPRVYGVELAASKGASSGRRKRSTPEEFDGLLDATDERVQTGVEKLMKWCESSGGFVTFGRGSCYLNWRQADGSEIWPLCIRPRTIEVLFETIQNRRPFDDESLRKTLLESVNRIPGANLPASSYLGLRPSFPTALVADESARQSLIEALQWFVRQLNRS